MAHLSGNIRLSVASVCVGRPPRHYGYHQVWPVDRQTDRHNMKVTHTTSKGADAKHVNCRQLFLLNSVLLVQ